VIFVTIFVYAIHRRGLATVLYLITNIKTYHTPRMSCH